MRIIVLSPEGSKTLCPTGMVKERRGGDGTEEGFGSQSGHHSGFVQDGVILFHTAHNRWVSMLCT